MNLLVRTCSIGLVLVAGCFSGEATRGLPCTDDASCGDGLACVHGVCGGGDEPSPEFLRGAAILFVIDDAAESAQLQHRLSAAAPALFGVLEQAGAYRVAVVTADLGGPRCDDPGDGAALVATSCRDELLRGTDVCVGRCPVEFSGVPLQPTAITAGGPLASRPWLQGGTVERENAPDGLGLTLAGAFACLVAQDLRGCSFGQPLAAARRAIERALDPSDPAYGFVREDEVLALVFVTAGVECSHPLASSAAFDPAGERVFWGDPTAAEPTPAVCWNAGVACSNEQDGSYYYECHAVDRDLAGGPARGPSEAVLTPVDEYVEFFRREVVEARGGELVVAAITGVDITFAGDPAGLRYPVPDAAEEMSWGTGVICGAGLADVLPPVRLREFAAAFGNELVFATACDVTWDSQLRRIAEAIYGRLTTPRG